MKSYTVIAPGTRVEIHRPGYETDPLYGAVMSVEINAGGHVRYHTVWWEDGSSEAQWLEAFLVSEAPDHSRE